MNKETIISTIENRILSEHKKYSNKDIEWAKIAAHKIYAEFFSEDILTAIAGARFFNKHNETIENYAKGAYYEKFKDADISTDEFHYYNGYVIVSENELKIKFTYGPIGTDIEYDGSFITKID